MEGRRLALESHLDPGLPTVSADPDQLQQVLVNLLLNACDASPPGSRLRMAARRGAEGHAEIEVEDWGCGIAPEHLNAVFDPFFTTKKRGEGTGLGLSIVASIVRNHGGHIEIASLPEKGTRVTIRWPVEAVRTGETPAPAKEMADA